MIRLAAAGRIGKEQIDFARKALADNAQVRWTLVFVHRPLWTFANGTKNGWSDVEKALSRPQLYRLRGARPPLRKIRPPKHELLPVRHHRRLQHDAGLDYNEFDQIVWVTMKKEGPVLANILLDSVLPENLKKVKTEEPGSSTAKRLATHPAGGFVYFEGTPIPGAS